MTTGHRDWAMITRKADGVEIVERAFDHPDAAQVLRAFYDEQVDRYGFADAIDVNPHEYAAPNGIFLVAYHQGVPVGCAGYRWFDRTTGVVEIKKTYLAPSLRGLGVGRSMLSWLERHAAAAGACRVILETGVRNMAALRLFTQAGYQPAQRYVDGRDPAINRALAKSLTEPARPLSANARQATAQ